MEINMSFTYLYGTIPSDFCLLKNIFYLGMYQTHIHGTIPDKLGSMHQNKYLSIKSSQLTTQFLWLPRYVPNGCSLYTYSTFDIESFG